METNQFNKAVEQLLVGKEYSRKSLGELFELDKFSQSREGLINLFGFTILNGDARYWRSFPTI